MILLFLALAAADPADPDPAPPVVSIFDAASAVDTGTLAKSTAREDVSQIATSNQTAAVANNSVTGTSVTGAVTIDGNAFQNAQGFTLINANSGNNVAINASLNVNVRFTPGP